MTSGQGKSKISQSGPTVGDRPAVKSAMRSLEVFRFFSEERRPTTTSEIAHAIGMPVSSASFLLRSLLQLDYLVYDRHSRTYFPSSRFSMLGSWMADTPSVPASFRELTEKLSRETGETAILAMQSGTSALYIDVATRRTTRHSPVRVGLHRPITKAGVGKVLLSLKSDREVKALLGQANREAAERSLVEIDRLRDEIAGCRTHGYAQSRRMIHRDMDSIAMHLPLPAGEPTVAIAVGGEADRIEARRDRLISIMRQVIEPFRLPPQESLARRNMRTRR